MSDRHAKERYAPTLASLYAYYARANEELYALMESLGPASGWTGRFPTAAAAASAVQRREADFALQQRRGSSRRGTGGGVAGEAAAAG